MENEGIVNEQQNAEREAQALAATLNTVLGGGWEAKVWENGGRWCYCAAHPSGVKLYEHKGEGSVRFNAYYDPNSREVGAGATPLQALSALRTYWTQQIDQLQRELAQIQRVFGETR